MRNSPIVLLLVGMLGCGSGTETAKPPAESGGNQAAMGEPIVNSVGMKLALIPAGEFQMGSSISAEEIVKRFNVPEKDRESLLTFLENEKPQHLVKITEPFYMSVYEVTQQQYEQVMA